MNPISLAMDGLLAVLLLTAVAVGVRLNGKLKLLREGQGQFVKAVGDLDVAAGRAEGGLQALRTATEEAHDVLLARIETARALLPKLDRAAEDGSAAAARLDDAVRAADAADRRARSAAQAALDAAERVAAETATAAAARPRLVEVEPALRAAPADALFGSGPAAGRGGEPIPFPGLGRTGQERGLAAALRAAERIVEAETVSAEPVAVTADRAPVTPVREPRAPASAIPAGGDRLARFVARRRSARG